MSAPELDQMNQEPTPAELLKSLKERATAAGLTFSPNIGYATLLEKYTAFMDEQQKEQDRLAVAESRQIMNNRSNEDLVRLERISLIRHAQKMTRVVVTPNSPHYQQMEGMLLFVGNSISKTEGKYIHFNRPWMVNELTLQQLKSMECSSFRRKRHGMQNNNDTTVEAHNIPAFNVQILPMITQAEIEAIGRRQVANDSADFED